MNITIIGTGFVGVVSAAVYAKLGHQVAGLDIDQDKISKLNQGKAPFYEPDLQELINQGINDGKLTFTTDYAAAVPQADLIVIAVGTPSAPDGTADLKFVETVARQTAIYIKEHAIIGIKSTVPPGTNAYIENLIQQESGTPCYVVSLPEFLREGSAVHDTLHPDRVVIGAQDPKVVKILTDLHQPLSENIIVTRAESAQMGKYASNAYLAQRITYINQIADLCEKNGANINEVIRIMGQDKRIGSHYWYPGLGYGGSCFPKDVKELSAYAKSVSEEDHLLTKIDQLNEARIPKKLNYFEQLVGGFQEKTVAVLGLSFKPNTNDMRFAPSLSVIPYLIDHEASVRAHDPQAIPEAKSHFTNIYFAEHAYDAASGADIVILLIEWQEYQDLDFRKLAKVMNKNAWVIDTRNQFEPMKVKEAGLSYVGIGVS